MIGPDLGGAAAAALLARRGLRVLLAPLAPVAPSRESDGWLLPAFHPALPPLRQLSAAVGVIDELGLIHDFQRQASGGTGAFQLLAEKMRLSLPADRARRRAELLRELGEEGAGREEAALNALDRLGHVWDPFLATPPPLPPRGFFERRRLQKILPIAPEPPRGWVGDALRALAPFAASLVGDSAPEATAREAAALFRAPLRLWGGAAHLAELIRKKALEAGAQVLAGSCTGLRLDRKGVLFELAGSEVRAGSIVIAASGDAVAALCAGGGRAERELAAEAALEIERKVVLAHFVVRPEGLPLALEDVALLLGHAEGPLLLSAVPARKARGDASGERLLTVAKLADRDFSDATKLLASVRSAIEPVLPFFDRHVVHEAADISPSPGHSVLKSQASRRVGLRPFSAAHPRVLFASAAVYPGFGIEGSLLAARAVAQVAVEIAGRKQVSAT